MFGDSMRRFRITTNLLWGVLGLPAILAMGQTGGRAAATAQAQSQGNPVLVELFTSEGCSSCPPADEFVRNLDQRQPIAGAQLIVLSEHVDYWDHEGWKDPYSSPALTDRQAAYERALGLNTPYTPQLIVDGATEIHLTNLQQMQTTFLREAAAPKISVRLEGVSVDAASSVLRAHVSANAAGGSSKGDVYLTVALNQVDSHVLHGENGGRRLVHTAVVVQLEKIGKLEKGPAFEKDVQVKLKPGIEPRNLRVIAFVQAPGPGRLLGATLCKSAHVE